MTHEPELLVHDSAEALAADVAERLLVTLHDAQADRRQPHLALTGGTIADLVHETIGRLAPSSQVDWADVTFWWGDERFVDPDSPDRNALQARHALFNALEPLGLDLARLHEMPSTAEASSVDEAATAYGDLVRAEGAGEFEVVMLGMGPDGHVASLFPGFPQLAVADAIAVGVTDSPKPPPERVSLTFPALNRTREVWFLVSGAEKADAVAAALSGPADGSDAAWTAQEVADCPARGVRGTHATRWFLDTAAASAL